jgi:hypothetical protein
MQAIVTKYFGAGNVKGSRIKAKCQRGSITLHYDDGLSAAVNHKRAALALASKLEWDGAWVAGGLPSGELVWVLSEPYHVDDVFNVEKTK